MILAFLLSTCGVLLLNGEFMESTMIPYDTLLIKDSNFNSYTYISETNYYDITGNSYELINNTLVKDSIYISLIENDIIHLQPYQESYGAVPVSVIVGVTVLLAIVFAVVILINYRRK